MAQTVVYLFAVAAIGVIVGSSGQAFPRCPVNSYPIDSLCPLRKSCRPSCDRPLGAEICPLDCDLSSQCACSPGYLLDSQGNCVRPSECPNGAPVCPANKVWSDCASACSPTCLYPNGPPNVACAAVCLQNCVCKDGFLPDDKGECIEKSKCPPQLCPANSTYSDCPKPKGCRPSCKYPNGAEGCAAYCDPNPNNACVCNSGYVLNETGECVLKSQC